MVYLLCLCEKKKQFRSLNNSILITANIILLIFTHSRIACDVSSPFKELIKSSIIVKKHITRNQTPTGCKTV